VDKNNVSPTALSSGDAAHLEGGPEGPAAVLPRPEAAARPSGSTAGRVTALVIGALLVLASLGFLGARRRMEAMQARGSLQGVARAFDPAADVPGLPDWQCIPTPGHTPGHIAFFRPHDRVLITGDAALTVNLNSIRDLLRGRHRPSGPPYISTWNWPAAKQSVTTLSRLEPAVLAAGHGRPMTGSGTAAHLAAFAGRFAGVPGHRSPRSPSVP
jgi:glyoxylase-like metal-dependent hydrolase (beta-lactamase superfamily II)